MVMKVLEATVDIWRDQIGPCKKAKQVHFGKTADRAWAYLGKSYKALHLDVTEFRVPIEPKFKTRRNLAREYIALMLPMLHHQVPVRQVSPRRPPVPDTLLQLMDKSDPGMAETVGARQTAMATQEQMLAFLMQWWLNYLPGLYGLSREARTAIPEALVKGRGVVWHELMQSPHGLVPASFYGSVDDLLCDDASRQWRDCGYIIRRRHSSLREVAKRFGANLELLRSQYQSAYESGDSNGEAHGDVADVEGENARDVCVYYEIWSRTGIGDTLPNAPEELRTFAAWLQGTQPQPLEHVYLVYMPGVPHPLNVPPSVMDNRKEVLRRLRWPIECYKDPENPWPCSVLDFYPNSDNPWSSSPLEGSLPLLAFLDHVYSYLLGRVARSSCDTLITSAEMESAVRDAIEKGVDLEIVVANGKVGDDMRKLIEVLKFPEMQKDLWQVIPMVERAFERASGMLPEAYGSQPVTQDRSAAATQAREGHLTSRPMDFANMVEAWHSQIAAKEAAMSRMYVSGEQIAPLFGESTQKGEDGEIIAGGDLTAKWMQLVNTNDPAIAVSEMLYTVEAGSGQRKNKQKQSDDTIQIVQTLMPAAMAFIERGNVDPYNQVIDFLAEAFERPLQRMKAAPVLPTIPAMLPDGTPPTPPGSSSKATTTAKSK